MRFLTIVASLIIVTLLFAVFVAPAHAQGSAQQQFGSQFQGVCSYAGTEQQACITCATGNGGVWTAFGCIPATPEGLFKTVYPVFTGIAGGIAFLLILFGGFQIMTSAGNPEQLNEGRELVTSAVAGLLLIIFSVFLLKLIGFDILAIPGFGQ